MPKRRMSKTVGTHFNKEFFFYQLVPSFLRLLYSRHNKLQIHRHKIGFSKTISCKCGYPIQDEKHIMLHCPIYLSSREIMINSIERTFDQEAVPFWKRKIDLSSVLSPNLHYGQKVSNNINQAVYKFLGSLPANLL